MALFFTKGKPQQPPEPEMVTIEHDGLKIELPKLGSLTLGERLAWADFQAQMETRTITTKKGGQKDIVIAPIDFQRMSAARFSFVYSLALCEIREATLNPEHEKDFSVVEAIATGSDPAQLGLALPDGSPITQGLMDEIAKFWNNEFREWEDSKSSPEKKEAKKK